jgi:hypothetical protein
MIHHGAILYRTLQKGPLAENAKERALRGRALRKCPNVFREEES